MHQAGFESIPSEWWHFDALPPGYVRNHYSRY
jgi:D-alanyl-D-alanine dipeptidase